MAKTAIPEATRGSYFNIDPALCTIVATPGHYLYQPGAETRPLTEEFIQSLDTHGNIQPIKVCPDGDGYLVVVGRRRVRAALVVNERRQARGDQPMKLQALVQRGTPQQLFSLMVEENAHRTDVSPTVQALEIQQGITLGLTETELAASFGVNVQTIKNRLRLLDCDESVQEAVNTGKLAEMQARELAALPREEQKKVLEKMVASGATKGVRAKKEIQTAKGNGASVVVGRVRSRKFLESWKKTLQVDASLAGSPTHATSTLVCQVIDFVLGDNEALEGIVPVPTEEKAHSNGNGKGGKTSEETEYFEEASLN